MSQSPGTPRSPAADAGSDSDTDMDSVPECLLEAMKNAAHMILPKLRTGFYSYDMLVDMATDSIADELESSVEAQAALNSDDVPAGLSDPTAVAEGLVASAWEQRLAVEEKWELAEGERTTGEKLDAALEAMEERGVVARMNFTCCKTCGHSEIGGDIPDDMVNAKLGYCFSHEQDVDRLVPEYDHGNEAQGIPEDTSDTWEARQGGELYIAFGLFKDYDNDEKTKQVAETVVECLRAEGLTVTWNGSVDARISVDVQPWRKRLDPDEGPPEEVDDEGSEMEE